MNRSFFASLVALAATTPVFAQTAAPPPGNIDDRVRQQVRTTTEAERQEALLTGDSDILLLRRTQLFSLTGALDITATSNAALAPLDERRDSFAQGQAGIAIATRIGDKVDVFASTALVGVRYFKEKALDYTAISGVVGARVGLGRLAVTATYQPSLVFNRDFSRRQLTAHRFRLGASLGLRFRGISIEPEIHGERAITHPADYSAWSGGGSLTLSAPLSASRPIFAYVQAGYDRRSFDDYFSAFVGTRRLDDNLSAGVGLVWRPRRWGELHVNYSFGRNWSTSDVNAYKVHSGTLGITATLRF
jgi:hypothetical protein